MKRYKFGFSLKGFLAFLLAMFPNIVWVAIPPLNDVLAANTAAFPVWEAIAAASQWLMIAALILFVHQNAKQERRSKLRIGTAAFCLAGYYLLWVLYYAGVVSPWLFIGMAVLPAAYFVLVALWLKNDIALVPAALFGAIHIALTGVTYLK